MYILKAEAHFDSAHFLSGYKGKCANIHGHRWLVQAEISSEKLASSGQLRGMVTDFSTLKADLKALADGYDHALIYEKGTLKEGTISALEGENFRLVEVDFRPTAENFAEHFYTEMAKKGYNVNSVTVYETPDNCAVFMD